MPIGEWRRQLELINRMNVALLLAGQPRTFAVSKESLVNNLIKNINPDIFIVTSPDTNLVNGQESSFNNPIFEYVNTYNVKNYIIHKTIEQIDGELNNRLFSAINFAGSHQPVRIIANFYNNYLGKRLMVAQEYLDQKTYDIIIKLRPDFNFLDQLTLDELKELSPRTIYTNHYDVNLNWVGDNLALGHRDAMLTYLDTFTKLEESYNRGITFQPEIHLARYILDHNLSIEIIAKKTQLLRVDGPYDIYPNYQK